MEKGRSKDRPFYFGFLQTKKPPVLIRTAILCYMRSFSFSKQLRQTIFPLKLVTSRTSLQKMQDGWYFFNRINSSSIKISTGSSLCKPNVRLSSIGRTTLPKLSIFRTIPVDFMSKPFPRQYSTLSAIYMYSVLCCPGKVNIRTKHFPKETRVE